MKKKRFTEEQIIGVLREQEAGAEAASQLATTGCRLRQTSRRGRLGNADRLWMALPVQLTWDESSGVVPCCRFRGRRDTVFHEAGGWLWRDGYLVESSRSRRFGW
jgi:hypothetical protein